MNRKRHVSPGLTLTAASLHDPVALATSWSCLFIKTALISPLHLKLVDVRPFSVSSSAFAKEVLIE